MILEKMGIFGWKERDENLLLASLLTGDPLLLIGNHGCAKTYLANKLSKALGRKFLVYDASKAMFEDVLGYPNVEKLKQGVVEYVPSPVTIWDKEFVLIDELNRALPELQSKWLEIIRSRKVMGFSTEVKWVWSAMNPMSYSATQALDEALIGRFALFVYPPDVLEMDEKDRILVTSHINGEDAPSIEEWLEGDNCRTVSPVDEEDTGRRLREMLYFSARHFNRLRNEMGALSEFLAKFADLLMRESKGEVAPDGRRLGFIYRNILSNRAVELAKKQVFGVEPASFVESARFVVQSSIPVGLNDESLKRDEAVHKMEICFDLLSSYFDEDSEIEKVNRIYELFTTDDLMRKAEILLSGDISKFAGSKAWKDLIDGEGDITLLAYTALQIEAMKPGTIPPELLESLSREVKTEKLSSWFLAPLKGESIEHIDEVEGLLEQDSDLGRLVAFDRVSRLARNENITPGDIEKTRDLIRDDIQRFEGLVRSAYSARYSTDNGTCNGAGNGTRHGAHSAGHGTRHGAGNGACHSVGNGAGHGDGNDSGPEDGDASDNGTDGGAQKAEAVEPDQNEDAVLSASSASSVSNVSSVKGGA